MDLEEFIDREYLKVLEWHLDWYERMGFERWQAEILEHFGVDPHDAEKLVQNGCPHKLAVRILT